MAGQVYQASMAIASDLPPNRFIAAATAEVTLGAGGRPARRLQLLPLGMVEMRDGRGPYLLPPERAQAVIDASRRHAGRTLIMVDYDHQHHFGVKDGVAAQAPAAGWIDPATLVVEADGIWADVEWTAAARARLEAREYRYISPLFAYDGATKHVVAILAAGLTNAPAIESLAAAASLQQTESDEMLLSKIAVALGLADSATEQEVMDRIAILLEGDGTAAAARAGLAAAAQALGLPTDATADQVRVAAASRAAGPDPADYVPMAAFSELQDRVAELVGDRAQRLVAAAMDAGKIVPALRDWAIGYATTDEAGFRGWVDRAPSVLPDGPIVAAGRHGGPGNDGLTDAERVVAASLRLTPEAYLAAKAGMTPSEEA